MFLPWSVSPFEVITVLLMIILLLVVLFGSSFNCLFFVHLGFLNIVALARFSFHDENLSG